MIASQRIFQKSVATSQEKLPFAEIRGYTTVACDNNWRLVFVL